MKNRFKILGKNLVATITILTLLIYIVINIVNNNEIYGAQYRENYNENKILNYPGYKELIESMKQAHPNWNFTIFYTGLDWNQVIKNETTAYHGRNLVSSTRPSSWVCSICGDKHYDNGSWRCASEAAVSYYMDTRNWINDSYIFQFENLAYNETIQTLAGVQKIISNVRYMQGDTITYTKTDGTKDTLNKSYAQVIVDAAREARISPYHLAARVKQEQGAGSSPGATATGTYGGYVGYYNFLNIKATGATEAQVITNGLEHAKKNNWTNPEISIKEGAKVIASNYINDGQDTLYLQKFDVDSSDGTLYYFQYMQNVSAAASESLSVKSAYEELGFLNNSIDFIIPVYENMPETVCREPVPAGVVTQNVKVKGTSVRVRAGASTSAEILKEVNTGDVLLRIETATTTNEGIYWDKVVLPDGRKGYVSRTYLEQIADVSNCNDTVITNTSVNLRNGPGTDGTTVITMLTKGQVLTRIETGKYNLNGYIWDRVKLPDGRQGYIAQNYINITGTTGAAGELIKVICNSGLKVRELPGTGQKVLTYLDKGDTLTRIQAGASNANGYVWDKVVTATGIEGFIARGDSKEMYIEVVGTIGNGGSNAPTIKNDNFKLEDGNLISEPDTTVESIKEKYTDTTITVKNASGTVVTTGNVGTGYTITIEDKTYTIVKLGDVNGDGEVDIIDMALIKRDINNTQKLQDLYKQAGNLSTDTQEIDIIDMALIKRHIVGSQLITI